MRVFFFLFACPTESTFSSAFGQYVLGKMTEKIQIKDTGKKGERGTEGPSIRRWEGVSDRDTAPRGEGVSDRDTVRYWEEGGAKRYVTRK